MGWERGRYYTRSKKVNGRVVREYLGSGRVAELAAQLDTTERERRDNERAQQKLERDRQRAVDEPLEELVALVELLARAALRAAGFHQHKRGEWRKKRVRSEETR